MEPAIRGLSAFGFAFDPFEYLDSTKDAHLQEYLIIPKTVEIALSDQPVAIFAQPGGGKSALRIYTENFYKESRGIRFPVTYVPDDYSTENDFHFIGIKKSLASAAFMYLASYPDLFFALSPTDKRKLIRLLLELPLGLDFNLQTLRDSRFLLDLERTLGSPAFSNLPRLDRAHHQLAHELEHESPSEPQPLDDDFALLNDVFGARSIHILVDGLDGFMETQSPRALLAWIEPLLNTLETWEKKNIYLKFFLPMDISDAPALTNLRALRAAALTWDDHLLAEVIRRRVFAASSGAFDRLDAISTPDLRNVELSLARQLGEKEKLPRQIILKCQDLLRNMIQSNRTEILTEDLSFSRESFYVTAI
ncbi:MAG TPA: hypothetical protein PLM89_01875 [Anaerolineales bacterium]|nr:hypothetical protein [Anaerolineales bacterium]